MLQDKMLLTSAALANHAEFWKAQLNLAGGPRHLPGHVDDCQTEFATADVRLTEQAGKAVLALSKSQDLGIFVVIAAGLSLVLSRAGMGERVALRMPRLAKKGTSEPGELTVALQPDAQGTLKDLLQDVKTTIAQGFRYQDFPLDALQQEMLPRAGCLANVGLVSPAIHAHAETNAGLQLTIHRHEDSLTIGYRYDGDTVGQEDIRRLAAQLDVALTAMADLTATLHTISTVTTEERTQLLGPLAGTPLEGPNDRLVHELFDRQAVLVPDHPAVRHGQESLSYRELATQSDHLAAHLQATYAVQAGDRVAVFLDRGIDPIVSFLAILKMGAVYVPIDPNYPEARVEFIMEDAAPKVLISHSQFMFDLVTYEQLHIIDIMADELAAEQPTAPASLQVGAPAYIMYTSGSTGTPKGVVISHQGITSLVLGLTTILNQESVILQAAPITFDAATFEIWGALLLGGTCAVLEDPLPTSESLARTIQQHQVNTLWLTATLFNTVIDDNPDVLAPVSYCLVGGEALSIHHVRKAYKLLPNLSLINGYGPTESTTFTCCYPIPTPVPSEWSSVPIGFPIGNRRIYVLGPHGELLPIGAPGELYIGGEGLALGYLNRDELSAKVFITSPFHPDERLYRSGDMVRLNADGLVTFIGRTDNQVKVRGYRIELGEIETALSRHPRVRQALVRIRKDDKGHKSLLAYALREADATIDGEHLRQFLSESLPGYMIPSHVVLLDQFPMTVNGKVDIDQLPHPDGSASHSYQAPETAEEAMLATIWQEVLGPDQVGITDNFYALGGDSLRAIQVLSRLKKQGFQVELHEIFEHQDIRSLAPKLNRIDTVNAETGPFDLISHQDRKRLPEDVTAAFPLSKTQEGMVFHTELGDQEGAYHDVIAYRLQGEYRADLWHRTFAIVTARHPILRVSFALSQFSQPLQLVHREATATVSEHDLQHLDATQQDEVLEHFLQEESNRPFAWAQAPLFRVFLHRRAEQETQLTISIHHAIIDGWSLTTFMSDWLAVYEELLLGREPDAREEQNHGFREYIALEKAALAHEDSRDFWREQLAGMQLLRLPRLPLDPRETQVEEASGDGRLYLTIPADVTQGLHALSRTAGVSLKSVLLAAHLKVLATLSGRRDIVTGLISNGRPESGDADRSLGLFLNTLPLRITLGSGSWLDLARTVFDAENQSLPHRRYPLPQMMQDLGSSELFETIFNFINFHAYNELDQFTKIRLVEQQGFERSNFTLAATFRPLTHSGELTLNLETNPTLIGPGHAQHIGHLYQRCLTIMAAEPEASFQAACLLDEDEQRTLLQEWSHGPVRDWPTATVLEQVGRIAAQHGDLIALESAEARYSYRELESVTHQLAVQLAQRGVGPGDVIGLCVHRSPQTVLAVLAVLKLGAAYVPIDPSYPDTRIHYMVEHSGLSLVLTHGEGLRDRFQDDTRCLALASLLAQTSDQARGQLTSVSPEDTAYIIFTSGSTGQPKGVVLHHAGLLNLAMAQAEVFGLAPGRRVLQFASFSFDASVSEMFATLCAGATLVVPSGNDILAGHDLRTVLLAHQINKVTLPPSVLATLGEPDAFPALTTIVVAGEACPQGVFTQWAPGRTFINAYGPTETTVCATMGIGDPNRTNEPPIGTPIANGQVFVLDEELNPVPVGSPGELYLGGIGLAKGYLNQPELTAERFITHPFSGNPSDRLYRSGDQGRFLPDGNLEFLGRRDQQVKIRGFRVELSEVKHVLEQHPDIADAVVLTRELGGTQTLVAYIVTGNQVTADISALRTFLQAKLPSYMVPSRFMQLERFPTTPNGKVDPHALPALDEGTDPTNGYVAPINQAEEVLAAIWGDILDRKPIGRHDHFFELGGHSLSATRVVARMREVFHQELRLTDFFKTPTIAALAASLGADKESNRPALIARATDAEPILSFAQQRMWFLDQYEGGNAAYNIPLTLRLQGDLGRTALTSALSHIVERHQLLRTRFSVVDGEAHLTVSEGDLIAPELHVVAGDTLASREHAARALISQEAMKPFDLAQESPLRTQLYQLDDRDHLFFVNFHHVAADGWSLGVFVEELGRCYTAEVEGHDLDLAALPVQYADFAAWQRTCLTSGLLETQLDYWRNHMQDATPVLDMPTDHPRPATFSYRGAAFEFELSAELTQALRDLGQSRGASLFMTLLAVLNTTLHHYTGQEDLTVGTPISGRNHRDLEGLIGLFVNTLALHTRLDRTLPFSDLIDRVRTVTLEAFDHQDVPFEHLVDALNVPRDQSHTPLFQTVLVLQNAPMGEFAMPGIRASRFPIANPTAKFDITFALTEVGDGLYGNLEYNSDLFEEATMRRLVAHFEAIAGQAVAAPQRPLGEMTFLSGEGIQALTKTWPQARAQFDTPLPMHARFETTAQQWPSRTALKQGDTRLSYDTVNRRANALAHHLRSLGVGPNTLVGLCLARTPNLPMAILAILKAGGAYVPLDPSYPAERASWIIDDSQIQLMVTDRHVEPAWLSQTTLTQVYIDDRAIAYCPETNPEPVNTPDDLMYVIYTSGSTGKPKGSLITHRNVSRLFEGSSTLFHFDEQDVWSYFHSFAFDFSVWELWGALLYGGTLVVVPFDTSRSPESFYDLLAEEQITVLSQTPSAFQQLNSFEGDLASPKNLALRYVVFGGEALDPATLTSWFDRHDERAPILVNMYGITETTVHVTYREIGRADAERRHGSPIGQALPDLELYALNELLQPVPVGVAGELFVAGPGLALGYLRRPSLTALRFLPHPFSDQPGQRLYRTGDVARFLEDGTLDFIGRCDRQVKIRGFRIELGEIEHALTNHPAITEARVLPIEDQHGVTRLAAYLIGAPETRPESKELRRFLSTFLTDYMIPAHFLFVDRFPLTAHGKLDSKALPKPMAMKPEADGVSLLPEAGKQDTIAKLWQDILGLDKVLPDDNFFELGGDSILSIKFIARARQAGLQLSPKDMFRYQSLAELAAVAQTSQDADRQQEPLTGEVPLTPIQHWFFDQDHDNHHHWNQAIMLRGQGTLQPELLEKALHHLVRHHDALRLRFHRDADQWRATYGEPGSESLCRLVVLTGDEQVQQHHVQQELTAAHGSLNIEEGPLLKAVLIRGGFDGHDHLMIAVHHLVVDAVSWGVLREDLETAYLALSEGREPALPPKTSSYRGWAQALNELAQSEAVRAEASFWNQAVQGAPLPLDRQQGRNTWADIGGVDLTLDPEQTKLLTEAVTNAFGARMNEVLLSALGAGLSDWSGERRFSVDVEGHGREDLFEQIDLSRTVGWFTAIYPVLLNSDATQSAQDRLIRLKEQLRNLPQAGLGYGLLRYLNRNTNPDDPSEASLSTVAHAAISFNYLGRFDRNVGDGFLQIVGEDVGPVHGPAGRRVYALDIAGSIAEDQLTLSFMFSREQFNTVTIERLAEAVRHHLQNLIQAVAEEDAAAYSPADFPLAEMDFDEMDKVFGALEKMESLS